MNALSALGPNRRVRLRSRPIGVAQAENFELTETPPAEPAEGQIVVRNAFLSVDPAMRGWIADKVGYLEPLPIGATMRSLACGHVVASRSADWAEGDAVIGWFGWQTLATVDVSAVVRRIAETDLPLSLSLGVLGLTGATALIGLETYGDPQPGETVVVSTAAGAVGSAVGQIAKLKGCRTVGIAGGPDKVAACRGLFGYDAAFDYRADDLDAALASACPASVHVYFDNVAGPISDAVHRHLAIGGRIIVCGTASVSDWSDWPTGPRVERHLLVKRARMAGFVLFDHMAQYEPAIARLAEWVRSGELVYREDVLHGLEACPDALAGLYRGENLGKRVVALA